jgi:transposase
MRQISEVLRLDAEGLSHRQIARSVGLSKTTVRNYLDRATKAALRWPLCVDLDAVELEARLFRRDVDELRSRRPEPDWSDVHRELKGRGHVTLRLLWMEYRRAHPDGWGYTQFCGHYRVWLGRQEVVMRLEYKVGDRLFVDFSGDRLPLVDEATDETAMAEIFVAVLGASGYLYVEATHRQDLESWLGAHVGAFEFYGGVPRVTVPDNLKAGVTKACWYDPELNPSYLELARHYGTVVLPTRTAHPRDKAVVEVGVQVAERWVLAPLRKRRFFSLAEMNAAIREQVAKVNERPFRGEPTSRHALFVETEKEALQPLPARRYEFATFKRATVNIDYHVEFDRRWYSVPHQLVREKVEMRATATTIEVFHRGRRVASHLRERGRRRFVTDASHMPASHRAHLEWTPSRLLDWAASVGQPVAELADRIMRARPHPEHGYRACLGLMRLGRRFGNDRLAAACSRALVLNACSYVSVESILNQNLDRIPLPEVQLSVLPPPLSHRNLRGAGYYGSTKEG